MPEISYNDFQKVDIRVGKIIKVEDFPGTRKPAYKIWVDFAELGVKKSSAQITKLYSKEDLLGKQVLAVVNFQPKQIAGFMSEILVLGVPGANDDEVVLIEPEREVAIGGRLY